MLSDELTVWGHIKVPGSYLEKFVANIDKLKGQAGYKDYPDFMTGPVISRRESIFLFGYVFRHYENFEKELIERFEKLLRDGNFLTASLHISIEDEKYFFIEYVSDGTKILKSPGTMHPATDEGSYYIH